METGRRGEREEDKGVREGKGTDRRGEGGWGEEGRGEKRRR